MTEKKHSTSKPSPKSRQPYKRRSEAEMAEIIKEIHHKVLSNGPHVSCMA